MLVNRHYTLGSEWVYLKMYGGQIFLEDLLLKNIYDISVTLLDDGIIDKWFFLRYHDEKGYHLRVRFHVCNNRSEAILEILRSRLERYVVANTLRYVYDIYVRELERYGASSYDDTETLFGVDSIYIVKMLRSLFEEEILIKDIRLLVALRLTHDVMLIFGLDYDDMRLFSLSQRESFRSEFDINTVEQFKVCGSRYRTLRKEIETVMDDDSNFFSLTVQELMMCRKEALLKIISGIEWEVDRISYMASIIHMSINRLALSDNRRIEMETYELLSRYYESKKYIQS